MSWKETYNTWKDYADLDAELKDELANLAGNDAALEDAFYTPMEFWDCWNAWPSRCRN